MAQVVCVISEGFEYEPGQVLYDGSPDFCRLHLIEMSKGACHTNNDVRLQLTESMLNVVITSNEKPCAALRAIVREN